MLQCQLKALTRPSLYVAFLTDCGSIAESGTMLNSSSSSRLRPSRFLLFLQLMSTYGLFLTAATGTAAATNSRILGSLGSSVHISLTFSRTMLQCWSKALIRPSSFLLFLQFMSTCVLFLTECGSATAEQNVEAVAVHH